MLKNHFLEDDLYIATENERPSNSGYVPQIDTIDPKRELLNNLIVSLTERLQSFPARTKFLTEIIVYKNKDLAGNADFIAITP